ncbi:MAG: VOC family protein [Gammaproteobacteria bacterium]|jgi:catechol 2,3-dioxygenase-like lactoylglutathione lyase family enzyme|nr:VOC family protein [Gammaproteobacteria bacterium]MBU2064362.1 VOC family protein [Gammaproteobacteria bacterium]MBU2138168.1 VOC family protein [Gammaproteobacteria bacterium]MBU2217943.1 VOC family protein [Gammaproteobacteria bacterium]MBU2323568.1 VOC family protein [Gammaproteobacteria bacterium]
MFTYITLGCSDLSRAAIFYDAALTPLGLQRCTPSEDGWENWLGWGTYLDNGREELALWLCKPFNGEAPSTGNGSMIALKADTWQAVRDFHRAALENGGLCEGPPALRPHYGPDFFAAYIRDPDGHKLAAVCRGFTTEPTVTP